MSDRYLLWAEMASDCDECSDQQVLAVCDTKVDAEELERRINTWLDARPLNAIHGSIWDQFVRTHPFPTGTVPHGFVWSNEKRPVYIQTLETWTR